MYLSLVPGARMASTVSDSHVPVGNSSSPLMKNPGRGNQRQYGVSHMTVSHSERALCDDVVNVVCTYP